MASSNPSSGAAAADDLDQLLDSALDDFTSLDLAAAPKSSSEASASSSSGSARPVMGLGMSLPDPRAPRRRAARQPRRRRGRARVGGAREADARDAGGGPGARDGHRGDRGPG
ncbi:hypothetical protein ZWY2020_021437 [Hordeum vulgare]|nr:hypothetical protein ZWY2020_021437 [Hordeum vulgare]